MLGAIKNSIYFEASYYRHHLSIQYLSIQHLRSGFSVSDI